MNVERPSETQCIYRAGCPKPDICGKVGHCTSMTETDMKLQDHPYQIGYDQDAQRTSKTMNLVMEYLESHNTFQGGIDTLKAFASWVDSDISPETPQPAASLVADLRSHAPHVTQGGNTMLKAADEIERLQAELFKANWGDGTDFQQAVGEIKRLRALLAPETPQPASANHLMERIITAAAHLEVGDAAQALRVLNSAAGVETPRPASNESPFTLDAAMAKLSNDEGESWVTLREAESQAVVTELQRIRDLNTQAANHWLSLNIEYPIPWEGALPEAVKAACNEIRRLRAHETTAPQAPIAKITVREGAFHYAPDDVQVSLYAPGLPPGEHDVYLDPTAPALPAYDSNKDDDDGLYRKLFEIRTITGECGTSYADRLVRIRQLLECGRPAQETPVQLCKADTGHDRGDDGKCIECGDQKPDAGRAFADLVREYGLARETVVALAQDVPTYDTLRANAQNGDAP